MRTLITTVLVLAALSAGCAAEQAGARRDTPGGAGASDIRLPEGARLVDLTYPFDDKTIYWPTATTGFTHGTVHHGKTEGGYFYSAYTLCAPEHGGTHLRRSRTSPRWTRFPREARSSLRSP